jgi:hypothetical protein
METEFNIETSTKNQFIDYEFNPSLCMYKLIIFSETDDNNVFTLLDKTGQCPNGFVTGPVKELCVNNIKELVDLELDINQIKFWYLDDSTDIIKIYYTACLQNNVDERWFNVKELKDIPMITEDYNLISKLYKFISKKDIND